jgi:hypothetical protein
MELVGPDDFYRVRNLRTGRHQRSVGAWSWALDRLSADGSLAEMSIVGGYWPAHLCAKDGATLDDGYRAGAASLDPPQL